PKRPPEGWSLPEREHDDDGVFWIEAEHSARVVMTSLERDGEHLLMVHVWRHDRTRMSDKQAARILRRFRAADSFVESTETLVNDVPDVRCFVARAHPAAPDTWGAHRARAPPLHVEASETDDDASVGVEGSASDVRHHLPSPLPAGWSTRATTKEEPDVACLLSAPDAELTVLLRTDPSSDVPQLVVSLMPPRGSASKVTSDDLARALLERFRGRGAFRETSSGPYARAPGMRVFVAP